MDLRSSSEDVDASWGFLGFMASAPSICVGADALLEISASVPTVEVAAGRFRTLLLPVQSVL